MDHFIRTATGEDYSQLCELFAQGDTFHREGLPHIFQAFDGPVRTREWIDGIISNDQAALFVAEQDNHLLGSIHIVIRQSPDVPIFVPRRYGFIESIIVAENSRRLGVGNALMERAHQWARDNSLNHIELSVWDFNEGAIALYEKLGYATTFRVMARSLI